MNFGQIKDIFSNHLVESYVNGDEKGKKLYKKFIKTLNEDEVLKTQFIVYKNIEKKNGMSDVEIHDYLKENISLFEKFNKSDIEKSNNKLMSILKENKIGTDLISKPVYNDINKLISLEKKASTINKIQESFNKVKNFMKDNKEEIDLSENVSSNVDPKKFLSIAVEKYNEKYGKELSEEETRIVNILRKGSDKEKEDLLKEYVKDTIKLVNDKLEERKDNITLKETLLNVKDMIYETVESENLNEGVVKLYELKKDLSE
jgi:hypothetical protein